MDFKAKKQYFVWLVLVVILVTFILAVRKRLVGIHLEITFLFCCLQFVIRVISLCFSVNLSEKVDHMLWNSIKLTVEFLMHFLTD